MATTYPEHGDARGTILGHPKGLFVLFFAEMWERFSYYGMRALLVLYLTKHWLFSDGSANLIYGTYTSLVYITPLLGGYLADRYLGQRKAVAFGAFLLVIGHGLMAFEGDGGQSDPTLNIFWLALAFIIMGVGFLKANISVMVGQLYPKTDVRRDPAYTLFYMGINLGSLIGTLIAGYLGETYGWAYGFGAAGIGMLLGLIVFVWGKPLLLGRGESPAPEKLASKIAGIKFEYWLYILGFVCVPLIWLLVQNQGIVQILLIASGAFLLGYVAMQAMKLDPHARDRIFAIIFLLALQPLFWALFEQAGSSMTLYTDRYTDRWGVPASLFQSINPMYIILLAPLFAAMWTWLGRHRLEPSTPAKFGLALAIQGLGFLAFVWGAQASGIAVPTPVIFIFLFYLFCTMGELCLSPVGLSAMNRLAPTTMASLIMGGWFLSSAAGNFLAGKIGEATGGHTGESSKETILQIYNQIGWISIAVGVAVLVISPLVKKLMHLDTLRNDDEVDHEMLGEPALAEPAATGINTTPETRH